MEIPYLKILRSAFRMSWKSRYLWWFGFFIAITGFFGLNYPLRERPIDHPALRGIHEFVVRNSHLAAAIAVLFILSYLVIIFLALVSRASLIDSLERIGKGEPVNFKSGFGRGRIFFWRIFWIALVLELFMLASIIVLSAPVAFLFFNRDYVVGVFMGILAAVILIPICVLTAYLKVYGYIYTVLGQLGFWAAVENAYELFRKNLWESIIMGLIFIPTGLILAILAIMVAIPVFIVFLGVGLVLFLVFGKAGVIASLMVGGLILILCFLALRSFYEVFAQAVWLLFFHEIAKPKEKETATEPEPVPHPFPGAMPIIEVRKD